MDDKRVLVVAVRAFHVRGHAFAAGEKVSLRPLDALSVLESGRGQLCDPHDIERLRAAGRAATDAALKATPRPQRSGQLMPY
jgi:hypothetical protein